MVVDVGAGTDRRSSMLGIGAENGIRRSWIAGVLSESSSCSGLRGDGEFIMTLGGVIAKCVGVR